MKPDRFYDTYDHNFESTLNTNDFTNQILSTAYKLWSNITNFVFLIE